jgi:5-methylcytosine-specific restriction enzyme A
VRDERAKAKRIYKQNCSPSVEEYVEGLRAIESHMNELQRRLLVEQYHAPERSVTGKQLASLAGLKSWSPVNSQYGRLGHMFCDATGHEPDRRRGGGSRWWAMWSLGYPTSKGFVWEMLPEVAEALERLDWVKFAEAKIPEEVISERRFVEGATRSISVNAYERNPEARRRCLEIHGTECVVCEIDLELVYGTIAQGFIHVHHLKPLSDIGEEYEVNPKTDLKPVCPNCHAIVHLGGKTRSIEEVRELVKDAKIGGERV